MSKKKSKLFRKKGFQLLCLPPLLRRAWAMAGTEGCSGAPCKYILAYSLSARSMAAPPEPIFLRRAERA